MKTPSGPPPDMQYIALQRAQSFARKQEPEVAKLSAGYPSLTGDVSITDLPGSRPPTVMQPPLGSEVPVPPSPYTGPPPSSKPPDMDYIAVQRAQSFARKRASGVQAASAADALGSTAFLKEALAAAGGQNNTPAGPPKSLLAKHPSLLFRFRPAGKDGDAPKRLECFAARAQSEQIRLLLEASRTPYDLHVHFFGESGNPDDYRSRANKLGELPFYMGEELGEGRSICGARAIARHLARHLCLAGEEDDPSAQAEVDEIWELSLEMIDNMQGFRFGSSSSEEGKFVKPGWWSLKRLEDNARGCEKLLRDVRTGEDEPLHFVGDSLTLADIGMLHALGMLEESRPGWLDRLSCARLRSFIASHTRQAWCAEYRSSPRHLPPTLIDYDFNILHADWHPRHYEYLTPMEEKVASAVA